MVNVAAEGSYLRKGRMEMFDAELWAIWIALKETAKRVERLQVQWVQKRRSSVTPRQ